LEEIIDYPLICPPKIYLENGLNKNRVEKIEKSAKSPCLHPPFGPLLVVSVK